MDFQVFLFGNTIATLLGPAQITEKSPGSFRVAEQ